MQEPPRFQLEAPRLPLEPSLFPPLLTQLSAGLPDAPGSRCLIAPGDVSGAASFLFLPRPLGHCSFRDVVATMHRTRLLVGMHGSALANMIFMQGEYMQRTHSADCWVLA